MNKNDLKRIQDNGNLPWKDSGGKWRVEYIGSLSKNSVGYKIEYFDTIFQALEFAEKLK